MKNLMKLHTDKDSLTNSRSEMKNRKLIRLERIKKWHRLSPVFLMPLNEPPGA